MIKKIVAKVIAPNSTENLVSESANVLDVFTDTVKKLNSINDRIDSQAAKKEAERSKIASEIDLLGKTKEKHNKVISKIDKLLE